MTLTIKHAPDLDDLLEDLRLKLMAAYNRGYRDGGAVMRENIFKAAENPGLDEDLNEVGVEPRSGIYTDRTLRMGKAIQAERAARGVAAKAIRAVLSAEPGLSIIEITARVAANHPEIAEKTIGNELRRREGAEYVRTDKYSWHLKGQETETAAPTDPGNAAVDMFR